MYGLMIVEDEPLEREAIALLVKKHFPAIQEIRMAENGFEAIETVSGFKPDIVLMDINMPGMNGLETIEKMSLLDIKTKYIIITSYSQFEYAQKAIRLGVEDFLIKPADIETIRKTLAKVMKKIDKEIDSEDSIKQLEKQLTGIQPLLENDLVHLISNGSNGKRLLARFHSLNLSADNPFVFVSKCKADSPVIMNRLRSKLTSLGISFLSDIVNDLIITIVLKLNEGEEFRDFTATLTDYFEQDLNGSCVIGVGQQVETIKELGESYLKAQTSLVETLQKSQLMNSPDDKQARSGSEVSSNFYADMLLEKILRQEPDIQNFTDHLFSELNLNKQKSPQEIEFYLYQVLILIRQKLSDRLPYLNLWENEISFQSFTGTSNDLGLLNYNFNKNLKELSEKVSRTNETRQNVIVQKAIDFIRENYHQNISLEDLSAYLRLSTFHISKVIKRSTNQSFPEILTRYRINEAIRIIGDDQLNIKEIAYKVGYNSQHYFSRIFKKYTGFSPSEYKNRTLLRKY